MVTIGREQNVKSFEEISKMNLAELDRPVGVGEEELETETTGAAGNHSVSDAEKAGTPGADDLETSINMSAAVSDNEEEKQPEELEKSDDGATGEALSH